MQNRASWDWESGSRIVADLRDCSSTAQWVEEPHVSPDGERFAAVACVGEAEFTLCVNGQMWENVFEKVWYPRYSPDGRLTALAQSDGEWTVAVDDTPWD